MKNIKAIIFDAYGTLFDVNSAAEKCKDKIGDKWEAFANYWRTTQGLSSAASDVYKRQLISHRRIYLISFHRFI